MDDQNELNEFNKWTLNAHIWSAAVRKRRKSKAATTHTIVRIHSHMEILCICFGIFGCWCIFVCGTKRQAKSKAAKQLKEYWTKTYEIITNEIELHTQHTTRSLLYGYAYGVRRTAKEYDAFESSRCCFFYYIQYKFYFMFLSVACSFDVVFIFNFWYVTTDVCIIKATQPWSYEKEHSFVLIVDGWDT